MVWFSSSCSSWDSCEVFSLVTNMNLTALHLTSRCESTSHQTITMRLEHGQERRGVQDTSGSQYHVAALLSAFTGRVEPPNDITLAICCSTYDDNHDLVRRPSIYCLCVSFWHSNCMRNTRVLPCNLFFSCRSSNQAHWSTTHEMLFPMLYAKHKGSLVTPKE